MHLLYALFFYIFACWSVVAQVVPLIESIDVQTQGGQAINKEVVFACIPLKEGVPLESKLLNDAVLALYESGIYENVNVYQELSPDKSKVRIIFDVVTKCRVSSIQFIGNKAYSDDQLKRELLMQQGAFVGMVDLKRDGARLLDFYEKKGYAKVKIDYQLQKNTNGSEVLVVYKIDEGVKLKLENIVFEGNDHVSASDLRDVMQTKRWWFMSWLTGSGVFEDNLFREDIERLIGYYKDQGFLDVVIPDNGITFEYPEATSMIVHVTVNEGKVYKIGEIHFEGNTLYDSTLLAQVLGVKTGDICAPTVLNEAMENVRDYYGQFGYLETGVALERVPNFETGDIDLSFSIKESGKFYVEGLIVEGNTKTKHNVILRELALAPGDVFDLVRMKASESRLKQTLFFEEVTLTPEAVSMPNRRNLRITVKEKRTGNIQFGVGFSSIEQAVAFVELTQSNFDIFNPKTAFQGAGQKLRIRLSIGSKSNQIFLNFEEPWLFDRELAFGFDLFRTDAKYVSSVYDELRYGVEFYFRKRLVELFVIRPYYKIEVVDIHNVKNDASNVIKANAGKNTISQIGFSITRETMDSILMPTRGSRMQFITDVAGVGGSADFVRLEIQGGRWWPTFRTLNQVFSLVGRTGTITPFNHNKVPFFEAYYLGGPNNLRGYSYRDIGPKDNKGEVIGGNTYAFSSAEYSFQVLPPVRLAAFYDIGFVNADNWTWSTSQYAHDIGVGARILMMGAPLRLDLAYPLRKFPGASRSWQFNFSFGTVF